MHKNVKYAPRNMLRNINLNRNVMNISKIFKQT